MASSRPQRTIRAPARFGWESEDQEGEICMDTDSEMGDNESDSDIEQSVVGGSDSESDSESNQESSDSDSESNTASDNANDIAAGWVAVDRPPNIPPFTGQPGVRLPQAPNGRDAFDYFSVFLNEAFFVLLADETNRYAHQVRQARNFGNHSRVHKWRDTTAMEIKIFFAILFAMGLDDRPTYACYWSNDVIFENSFFRNLMSRDRFLLILKFFHLTNNEARNAGGDAPPDKLWKIRPLITLLNTRFGEVYYPERDLCVDETMVPWTGRLSFKQYIPIKPDKYGIKVCT